MIALLYVDHQLHLGVDVAVDLEGSGGRKGFGNVLARVLFVAVETEARPLRIDLVDEVVVVGEGEAFTVGNRDLARMKGTALLDDGVRFVRGEGWQGRQQEKRKQFFHSRHQLIRRGCRTGPKCGSGDITG